MIRTSGQEVVPMKGHILGPLQDLPVRVAVGGTEVRVGNRPTARPTARQPGRQPDDTA